MEKFDKEIKKEFKDIAIIEYGIVEGNNTIVFIKAGQNGSLYGYQNKYVRMANNLNKKYGCSVICSSNPPAIKLCSFCPAITDFFLICVR